MRASGPPCHFKQARSIIAEFDNDPSFATPGRHGNLAAVGHGLTSIPRQIYQNPKDILPIRLHDDLGPHIIDQIAQDKGNLIGRGFIGPAKT